MVAPMVASPVRGEPVVIERLTEGGRRLFYRLEVIQQPERARACGSGPKSSADRRPVDPPPVVELRIFEGGPTLEQSKDITFFYNANFFLFATLEHSRLIAQGRMQTPAASTPPVLTGMPVSAMAYLDRPHEAGYFLFPDLSVRHEGRYRLQFNLYEETKEEKDRTQNQERPEGENFDWRMKVTSNDFVVFSAKKFPGLTESTALSRTVAEQGCRVRIRRDVRMRKRDEKVNSGYENNEDEYARRRRASQTPEAQHRARSMSNESAQRTPYSADPQRRPSGVDYPPPPAPGFAPPQASGGHLAFGAQPSPHYQQQPYARDHNVPSVPPSPSYPPPQQSPYHQPTYAAPPHTPSYSQERPPSQHYGAPNPSPQREDYPQDISRRPTTSYPGPPPPPPRAAPETASKVDGGHSFPPLQPMSEPANDRRIKLPPLSSLESICPIVPDTDSRLLLPSPTAERMPANSTPWNDGSLSRKRGYADTFVQSTVSEAMSLKDRKHHTTDAVSYQDPDYCMRYQRADGRVATKPTPMER